MQCENIEVYLTGYLDGELPQQQRQIVRLHMEDCPDCQATFDELKRVKATTRHFEFDRPSGEDWTDIHSHLLGRASRRLGWLLMMTWSLMTGAYGLYWYVDQGWPMIEKILVFGLISAVGLLFFSVLSERLKESGSDRYRGVHR